MVLYGLAVLYAFTTLSALMLLYALYCPLRPDVTLFPSRHGTLGPLGSRPLGLFGPCDSLSFCLADLSHLIRGFLPFSPRCNKLYLWLAWSS